MSDPVVSRSSTPGGQVIPVILSNTMGNKTWDIDVPVDKPVAVLVKKMLKVTGDPLRDANGVPQTYQLQWKEGDRYLRDAETMQNAGVQSGHTLVLAYEARAGARDKLRSPRVAYLACPKEGQ